MSEFKAKCVWCESDFTPVVPNELTRGWQEYDRTRYCSDYCKKAANRAYDRHVDPLGFYQSKAGDPYE